MDNYIVALGGSEECVYAMQTAKNKNMKIILVGIQPCDQALHLADIFIQLDLKQEDEILQALQKYKLLFVLPTPLGRVLNCMGAINSKFNLPGPSYEQIDTFTDKIKFNTTFQSTLNLAKQFSAPNAKAVFAIVKDNQPIFEYGFILKPRFGSGSKLVKFFDKANLTELNAYFSNITDEEIILEQFIRAQEYGVDAVIENQCIHILAIRQKYMTPLPHRQELRYIFTKPQTELLQAILQILQTFIDKTKIDNCFVNMDILVGDNQVYVIEAAPRASGNVLSENFIHALGINAYLEFIKLQLNENYSFTPIYTDEALLSYITFPADAIGKTIEHIDSFADITQLKSMQLHLKNHDKIKPITTAQQARATGWFLLRGKLAELITAEQRFYSKFKFDN